MRWKHIVEYCYKALENNLSRPGSFLEIGELNDNLCQSLSLTSVLSP